MVQRRHPLDDYDIFFGMVNLVLVLTGVGTEQWHCHNFMSWRVRIHDHSYDSHNLEFGLTQKKKTCNSCLSQWLGSIWITPDLAWLSHHPGIPPTALDSAWLKSRGSAAALVTSTQLNSDSLDWVRDVNTNRLPESLQNLRCTKKPCWLALTHNQMSTCQWLFRNGCLHWALERHCDFWTDVTQFGRACHVMMTRLDSTGMIDLLVLIGLDSTRPMTVCLSPRLSLAVTVCVTVTVSWKCKLGSIQLVTIPSWNDSNSTCLRTYWDMFKTCMVFCFFKAAWQKKIEI